MDFSNRQPDQRPIRCVRTGREPDVPVSFDQFDCGGGALVAAYVEHDSNPAVELQRHWGWFAEIFAAMPHSQGISVGCILSFSVVLGIWWWYRKKLEAGRAASVSRRIDERTPLSLNTVPEGEES